MARTFPEKSSSRRGSKVTTSERLSPIGRPKGRGPQVPFEPGPGSGHPMSRKGGASHLGGANSEEERLGPEAGLDHVCILRGLCDELHLERVRVPQDHVRPWLQLRAEDLARHEF